MKFGKTSPKTISKGVAMLLPNCSIVKSRSKFGSSLDNCQILAKLFPSTFLVMGPINGA